MLQQITERLPGRVERDRPRAARRAAAETALHHGAYEAIAAAARLVALVRAYFAARQDGDTPEQADKAADKYMEEAHDVVVSR